MSARRLGRIGVVTRGIELHRALQIVAEIIQEDWDWKEIKTVIHGDLVIQRESSGDYWVYSVEEWRKANGIIEWASNGQNPQPEEERSSEPPQGNQNRDLLQEDQGITSIRAPRSRLGLRT